MDKTKFGRQLAALRTPGAISIGVLFLLSVLCIVLYYGGGMVDVAGFKSLRIDFHWDVHDIQRAVFLVPFLYAGYVFGAKVVAIITVLAASTMLARTLYPSPFPDSLITPAIFCVSAGILGYLISRLHSRT